MSKVLIAMIAVLLVILIAVLTGCDAAGPVATKPAGCAHDTIEINIGQTLPDSLVVTCHPLPPLK